MRTLSLASSLLALALSSGAAFAQDAEPVYSAGQYTAVLHQRSGLWQLQPADGQDLDVRALACPTDSTLPNGLWLLVRDDQGRPELIAPSSTPLPAGSPDRVALRPCDEDGTGLAAPQALIDLLAANAGAVYVDD
jgi:hypothetical protein